ncbi:MAG: LCP family protein [Candidatus Doudnabacteria bacterium]|nr:LCP family protein [Candidatus Doudnabacteria bacterium]
MTLFVIATAFFLGGTLLLKAYGLSEKIFVGKTFTFWGQVKQIVSGDEQKLVGEDLGQINILLLGVGGEGHEGPYLTDTMMLAQIRPDIGTVSLTSIPRDYQVTLPENFGKQKINAAFALGYGGKEIKNFEKGGDWARQQVEKLSGLNIPYFALVDFSGFEKAIDEVGGIQVDVEKTFTDSEFPNNSLGYLPPQTFKAGLQQMDGKTALIFARSRHGNNDEGSDFARSKRQKKIIESFKEKTLSLNLISDSGTINKLIEVFANHFHTNLSPAEIFRLYKLSKEGKLNSILSSSLDPETKLVCDGKDPDTGAYIIFPCFGKNISDIQTFFKNSFSAGRVSAEGAKIWLGNSTTDTKKYDQAYKQLTEAGAIVYQVGYSKDFLPKTVVFQANKKPATVEFILNILNAKEATIPPKDMNIDPEKVDIVVILGEN